MSWLRVTTLTGFAVSVLSIAQADSSLASFRNVNAALDKGGVKTMDDTSIPQPGAANAAALDGPCDSNWESLGQADTEWRAIARGRGPVFRGLGRRSPNCNPSPTSADPLADENHSSFVTSIAVSSSPSSLIDAAAIVTQTSTKQFLPQASPEIPNPSGNQGSGARITTVAGDGSSPTPPPKILELTHTATTYARPNPDTSAFDDFEDDPLPPQTEEYLPPLITTSVQRAAESTMEPLPSTWFADNRGWDVILNVHGQPVVATYLTGATPHLVLPTPNARVGGSTRDPLSHDNLAAPAISAGPLTLSAGGPAVTYNGEVISLEDKGVVVGSRTISIAAVAPLVPTDSAATVTVDGHPMTFLKHAGNPAAMTLDSVTLSIGGGPLVTDGHTISINTRGELIVDDSQTVDATPLAMMSSDIAFSTNGAAATGAGVGRVGVQTTGLLTAQGGIPSFSTASPKKTSAVKGEAGHAHGQQGAWVVLMVSFAMFFFFTKMV